MPLALALLLSLSLGLTRADSYCEQATATARLACIPGEMITAINFASFGSPAGACGAYRATACSSPTALSKIAAACIGLEACTISLNTTAFPVNATACAGVTSLSLSAQYTCGARQHELCCLSHSTS